MTDPNFPDRPDHPDFWRLAAAVQDSDHEADSGQSVEDILARFADPASVRYMATQRAMRAMVALGNRATAKEVDAIIQSTWLDAFTAGLRFQAQTAAQHSDGRPYCEGCGLSLNADGTCDYAEMDKAAGLDHKSGFTVSYQLINEDGEPYDDFDDIESALARLREYPNDSIKVTLEANS